MNPVPFSSPFSSPYGGITILTAAWGSRSSSSYDWIYNHQGGRYNLVSKLYHFRNRDYAAAQGRWMQQDPAGYVDGASLYQALVSSPVTAVDPEGLRQAKPGPAVRIGMKLVNEGSQTFGIEAAKDQVVAAKPNHIDPRKIWVAPDEITVRIGTGLGGLLGTTVTFTPIGVIDAQGEIYVLVPYVDANGNIAWGWISATNSN